MTQTIRLDYEEDAVIELPGGKKISILLSYLEPGEQLPEIDIMLPDTLAVNCYGSGLTKAEPLSDEDQHVRKAKQIVVPIQLEANQCDT